MKRWLILLFGITSYLIFLGVFVYAVLFIGNIGLSRTLDSAPRMDLLPALAIDMGLLALFAIQHSGMARQGFKDWLTQYIPKPAERSCFVLLSNVALIILFAFWQPLGGTVWSIEHPFAVGAVYGLYFLGWLLLFVSTCAICHFDLFGLRQVWLYFRGQEYKNYEFRLPLLYTVVRHPLYVGWLTAIWAAPLMTCSHLAFALGTTAYILVAIRLEERDLVKAFGNTYVEYRKTVPMLIPGMGRQKTRPGLMEPQSNVEV